VTVTVSWQAAPDSAHPRSQVVMRHSGADHAELLGLPTSGMSIAAWLDDRLAERGWRRVSRWSRQREIRVVDDVRVEMSARVAVLA
jgi:pyrimidine operon attenuation protein/uracil phosphoribosyltransferase